MAKEQELQIFFDKEFPTWSVKIESVGDNQSVLRAKVTKAALRPGGTVSGPFMMAVADLALYAAILGEFDSAVGAVTTNLNINFLKRPTANADVVAECALLRSGSKSVVGEVTLYSDGIPEPIAHAVGNYSIPTK